MHGHELALPAKESLWERVCTSNIVFVRLALVCLVDADRGIVKEREERTNTTNRAGKHNRPVRVVEAMFVV